MIKKMFSSRKFWPLFSSNFVYFVKDCLWEEFPLWSMKWRYKLIVLREEEELRLDEIASFGINWLYHRCDDGGGNICEWIWKWQIFNNQHRHRKCIVGICHGSGGFRSSCWSWSRHQSPTTQEGVAHAEGSSSSASTNYWWVVSCLMRTAPCYAIPTTTTNVTNPTQHYNTKLYYFWVGAVQLSRRPKSTERWCTALETIPLV